MRKLVQKEVTLCVADCALVITDGDGNHILIDYPSVRPATDHEHRKAFRFGLKILARNENSTGFADFAVLERRQLEGDPRPYWAEVARHTYEQALDVAAGDRNAIPKDGGGDFAGILNEIAAEHLARKAGRPVVGDEPGADRPHPVGVVTSTGPSWLFVPDPKATPPKAA